LEYFILYWLKTAQYDHILTYGIPGVTIKNNHIIWVEGYMSSNMGSILYWVQPEPARGNYELRCGDRILATIEWKNIRSQDAEGMSGDKPILLKRHGFFYHHTTITDAGTGSEMAVFKFYGGDKGELKFKDGYKIRWKFEGMVQSKWYFTSEKGSELIRFSVPPAQKTAGPRTIAIVEVLREMDDSSVSLLSVIGWYNLYSILSTGL
jgi:hypothetical protein